MEYVILYGSQRAQRNGERVVRYLESRVAARGHVATVIDAREEDLPILDKRITDFKDGAPENLTRISETLKRADGFIFVTGEYNYGVQPGLMNLIDHFLPEYRWRPGAIVSYSVGNFAGIRAHMHLVPTLVFLGITVVSSVMPVPQAHQAFDETGTPTQDPEAWNGRADKLLSDLDWHAEALKAQRAKGTPF